MKHEFLSSTPRMPIRYGILYTQFHTGTSSKKRQKKIAFPMYTHKLIFLYFYDLYGLIVMVFKSIVQKKGVSLILAETANLRVSRVCRITG